MLWIYVNEKQRDNDKGRERGMSVYYKLTGAISWLVILMFLLLYVSGISNFIKWTFVISAWEEFNLLNTLVIFRIK